MYKLISFFILVLAYLNCQSQNLVQNGSLEQYFSCPDDHNQIDSALFWMNPSNPIYGTPDYFNECSSSTFASIPNNWSGFQYARTGTACAGVYLWSPGNIREYIENSLLSPLVENACYHFEMYVNLGNECQYTTDDIEVYFSNTPVLGINNNAPLPFVPQISNTNGNVFDTLNWTLVSGDFIASGGESYLIIGNFKNDSITSTNYINPSATYTASYCFIDDVSLVQIPPCNVGVNDLNEVVSINLFPNPFENEFNVNANRNELLEITIYDLTSRIILHQKFTNSVLLNTELLSKGMYFYEVLHGNNLYKLGKLIKD